MGSLFLTVHTATGLSLNDLNRNGDRTCVRSWMYTKPQFLSHKSAHLPEAIHLEREQGADRYGKKLINVTLTTGTQKKLPMN
jgi:hypothetical protein